MYIFLIAIIQSVIFFCILYIHILIIHRVNLIRNGSYLPSSELKFYISKLKLSTYQLQEKIEMIRDIISIYEKGFVITSECLVNYQQSIPIEISHIIYEYICNDFLIQAPLLRIILCERIKKFYKV